MRIAIRYLYLLFFYSNYSNRIYLLFCFLSSYFILFIFLFISFSMNTLFPFMIYDYFQMKYQIELVFYERLIFTFITIITSIHIFIHIFFNSFFFFFFYTQRYTYMYTYFFYVRNIYVRVKLKFLWSYLLYILLIFD